MSARLIHSLDWDQTLSLRLSFGLSLRSQRKTNPKEWSQPMFVVNKRCDRLVLAALTTVTPQEECYSDDVGMSTRVISQPAAEAGWLTGIIDDLITNEMHCYTPWSPSASPAAAAAPCVDEDARGSLTEWRVVHTQECNTNRWMNLYLWQLITKYLISAITARLIYAAHVVYRYGESSTKMKP